MISFGHFLLLLESKRILIEEMRHVVFPEYWLMVSQNAKPSIFRSRQLDLTEWIMEQVIEGINYRGVV